MKIELPEKISTAFIYACMKFGNKEPDAKSLQLIEESSKLILDTAAPRTIYKEFSMSFSKESDEIYIANPKNRLGGQAIVKHLRGCEKCVLMAVTLGQQVDRLIRRAQITDMAKAVALDACASSLIEDLCDQINRQLKVDYQQQRMGLTTRFSPGYGDLSLGAQEIFSNLLEMEKKIGLTQSSEHLLLPRKSVTAIIGLYPLTEEQGGEPMKNKAGGELNACDICPRKSQCQFRASGGYCGKPQ